MSPVGLTDLKIKRIFGGVGSYFTVADFKFWGICLVNMLVRMVGRTYSGKGVFLPSKGLLESPFLEPLPRTLLRTLPPSKPHSKTESLSKNPSQKACCRMTA